MNIDFNGIIKSAHPALHITLGIGLASLGMGFASLIANSDSVVVGENLIQIERQAISNQKDLERSLLIIEIQKAVIKELKEDTEDFSRRYEAGEELAEQAEAADRVIPESQIEELKESIGESRMVLEQRTTSKTN